MTLITVPMDSVSMGIFNDENHYERKGIIMLLVIIIAALIIGKLVIDNIKLQAEITGLKILIGLIILIVIIAVIL